MDLFYRSPKSGLIPWYRSDRAIVWWHNACLFTGFDGFELRHATMLEF
jgi:hypothetical protein